MTMIVMVIVMIVLAAVVVTFVWPALADWNATDTTSPRNDAATATATAAEKPESLEGVLVRQLLSQEISRQQYLHAIERLAERDADRRPLSVPPDA